MMTPRLDKEDFEVEAELECVKQRMELKKREEVAEEDGTVTEEDLQNAEAAYKESKKVFDEQKKILDMSKMTVTDAKYNIRSFPMRAAAANHEVLIQAQRQGIMEAFNKVYNKECKENGEQKIQNTNNKERLGLKKLNKRVRDREIVVTTTDKSGKFAVVEIEEYKKAALVHLTDREITPEDMASTETLLNRHTLQIVKSLRMGTIHGGTDEKQIERMKQAFTSVGGRPGPIYFLVKDHKGIKEGDSMPATRPVCNARGGPGARLSNLLSTILNSASDAMQAETECKSTEEAMRSILECNRMLKSGTREDSLRDPVVMSMDVKALYPSLRKAEVCPIIKELLENMIANKTLTIENVDWHEVGKYLYITQTKEALIDMEVYTAIPERSVGRNARGRKPGPAYWDTEEITQSQKKRVGSNEERTTQKWLRGQLPTQKQAARMMAQMIADAVNVAMSNHMYRFDGKIYLQTDGGPIGDELAQAVARIVMIWWDRKFLEKCVTLEIDIMMYLRYVDDTNKLVVPPPPGTRFEEGKLRIKQDKIEIDTQKPIDEVAGNVVKDIANSVTSMLEFEVDVCSKHIDGKMPVLDLKMWTEKEQGVTVIRHEFYKKPMASRLTLRGHTAYPKSQLKAVMIQEILRRLRNCSPESSWEDRGKHLTEFAKSLQASGYPEAYRKKMFEIAVERFKKELEDHTRGNKDLYRKREDIIEQTRKKGGKATKDNWFKRKEGEKTTSILKVPYTRGKLAKEVGASIICSKEPEGIKTRVQEGGGEKLRNRLMRADPFPRKNCSRPDCPVVTRGMAECRETCYQGHATYRARCNTCKQAREKARAEGCEEADIPPDYVYIGETSRGIYVRQEGHIKQYKSPKESGFMIKHANEVHEGDKSLQFSFERTATDRDPMRRIIRESVQILETREDRSCQLMNSKDEYFGVKVITTHFLQE